MTVRIVALNPVAEPEDFAGTEGIDQQLADFSAIEFRIAIRILEAVVPVRE
jgi:hypothetical protein